MPAIALWTPGDGVLGALAPLGAAVAAPPALVIDLDPDGPTYPGDRSLAELVEREPSEEDLRPGSGVAVLRNGGVEPSAAVAVVEGLLERWPRVVLRLPPAASIRVGMPVVPVRPLLRGFLAPEPEPAVWQTTPDWMPLPAPGVRLPVPDVATVRALCAGRRPSTRSKWIRAWESVWAWPWR